MADPIREALERAARELQLVASSLTQANWAAAGSWAMNEARAARAALESHPPAAATDTPLDIDALLSPEGAYEPGTGTMAGAQLLTGRHGEQEEWWSPLYGCDTLKNLLDRIRTRILPHLRPPIAGIDVPGGNGDYGGLQELCEAEGVDVRIGAPLLKRAREAWQVADPIRAALKRLVELDASSNMEDAQWAWKHENAMADAIEALEAQPPAAAPASDGEREELAAWLREKADDERLWRGSTGDNQASLNLARAADLLREPAPAPAAVLVAVSQRPWKREGWCDVEGRCWWFNRAGIPEWQLADGGPYGDFCLPHWAIPQPPPWRGGAAVSQRNIYIKFGAMHPPIEEQLREQGFKLDMEPYCGATTENNYEHFSIEFPASFQVKKQLCEIIEGLKSIGGDFQCIVFWFDN